MSYAKNTDIAFPLLDNGSVNHDVIVDASLSTTGSVSPCLTSLLIERSGIFLVIETPTEKSYLKVKSPKLFTPYKLTGTLQGYVSFGPGCQRPLSLTGVSLPFSEGCVFFRPTPQKTYLQIDDGVPMLLKGAVRILATQYCVASESGSTVTIGVDSDKAAESGIYYTLRGMPQPSGLLTINNIPPAADGSFTLKWKGVSLANVTCNSVKIGVILNVTEDCGCIDKDPTTRILCHTASGLSVALPLDSETNCDEGALCT